MSGIADHVRLMMNNVYLFLGGTQKSGHEKPLEESVRPYEKIKSVAQNTSNITGKIIERSESGRASSLSNIDNSGHIEEDFQNEPSSVEDSLHGESYASETFEGTGNQNEGSLNEIKSSESGTKSSQGSENINQGTLSISGKNILSKSNGSSKPQLQTRKVKQSMLHQVKDNESDVENNLWWLSLPYVVVRMNCSHTVDFLSTPFLVLVPGGFYY